MATYSSANEGSTPLVSFIVPAHNEERLLGSTLDVLMRSATVLDGAFEIIVVDDGSTDSTAAVARGRGVTVVPVEHRQISATRNSGARAATGRFLFFIDADTRVNSEVLEAALEALARGAAGGGCLVRFDGRIPLYARILARCASRAQMWTGFAAGCFIFCRREAFDEIGGFDEALFGGEEVEFSRALKRQGRLVVLPIKVDTSGRKLRTYSGWTIGWTMAKLAIRGRRGVSRRENLSLWYGPRPEDPQPPAQ